MKKFIVLLIGATFCTGCYIPHPANRVGVKVLQPAERWDEVCTVKVNEQGEKTKRCRWVRSK